MEPLTDASCGTISLGGTRTVRRLGYGAMRLTGEGVWGPPDDPDAAKALLRRVVDAGVNIIDTADAYGPDVNETLIAEALRPYPDDLVIATKGGLVRQGPGQWSPDGRPEHLRGACEGSLARLGVEAIDLYQLHRPDPEVPFTESVGAIAELVEAGKVRAVGLSNVSVDQLREAQSIVAIASVQNRYNLRERSSEDVLRACEADGIAFMPYFPLGGFGFAKGTPALIEIGEAHGVAPATVALAWLLARSPVMTPIPGTSSQAHFADNLAAARLVLHEAELERLDAFRPELSQKLTQKLSTALPAEAKERLREAAGPLRRLWGRLRSRID
jgi:aryl-alcohol dehydrogenase-like predicted oxidoreductase